MNQDEPKMVMSLHGNHQPQYFKYVEHSDIPKWEAIGWINQGPAPGYHSAYSCILIWPFEGEAMTP